MDQKDIERLAVLEQKVNDMAQDVDEIAADVKDIKKNTNSQKGFLAGALFVVTPIWGTLLFFVKEIWHTIQGG